MTSSGRWRCKRRSWHGPKRELSEARPALGAPFRQATPTASADLIVCDSACVAQPSTKCEAAGLSLCLQLEVDRLAFFAFNFTI